MRARDRGVENESKGWGEWRMRARDRGEWRMSVRDVGVENERMRLE